MDITIKNHEDVSSQGATDAILGIIDLCSVKSRSFLINILFIICMPFILIFFLCIMAYVNKKLRENLKDWKVASIKSEENYDFLLKMRNQTVKAKERMGLLKDLSMVPFYLRPLLKTIVTNINIMAEVHDVLSEKLFLLPKGVTDEQIKEAAILNKDIEDLFGDDEDEYDYAKDFALEQTKITERK